MKMQLFPFQEKAVAELRERAAFALDSYNRQSERTYNQIVSLQAPTGSGKTIIMSELIEEILYGSERFAPQPTAVFVWLSDSPALNAQSKDKIDLKADKIRLDQCEIISEESFDQEYLSDGKIYFLNTQKLSKTGKLGKHGDGRQYTIWETLDNTAREKCDRLYFIIDEAHRGTQDKDEAGKATSIMQRFIKGIETKGMRPMPLVIGMSATAARFNALVERCPKCTSTKVIVSAEEVRASGLLKERIIVVYPEDMEKFNETAVLQAATREWLDKCKHWREYTRSQHYQNVNPVFVIQVAAGKGKNLSETDLSLVLSTIEKETERKFDEHEVVHTFSGAGDITINGLTIHHIEPERIADDRKVAVVLFKESLSTGWDCPRAETMMSFRRAEDATYIAQLLGRMVRTPLGSHVEVDGTLNEVRLFLPYYNRGNVDAVIEELANSEGGELPTVVDDEELSGEPPMPRTVRATKKRDSKDPNQQTISFVYPVTDPPNPRIGESEQTPEGDSKIIQPQGTEFRASGIQQSGTISPTPDIKNETPPSQKPEPPVPKLSQELEQIPLLPELDREKVLAFINKKSFLTYQVKDIRVNNYLKSLHDLASILTTTAIFREANDNVRDDITSRIHDYAESLRSANVYQKQKRDVLEMKLSVQMFDVFGKELRYEEQSLFTDTLLERQCDQVDRNFVRPVVNAYINRYGDIFSEEDCRIDCILFDADEACRKELHEYAKKKFHELDDKYRSKIANKDERCRRQYNAVVARGDAVSKHSLFLPEDLPSYKPKKGDKEYYQHLYADEEGIYKTKLNTWEQGTIEEEMHRPDFVCWLRNPSKASWALCIPYEMGNVEKPMYPDFLIVRMDEEGGYVVDVLEPHGDQYADSLPKAKGMAKYAAQEERLGRVQMIREVTDNATKKKRYLRLDFTKGEVREKIREAMTTGELDHIFKTYGKYENG